MSEFSISTYQLSQFSPEKIALIKHTIADGAMDDELAVFIHQCQLQSVRVLVGVSALEP